MKRTLGLLLLPLAFAALVGCGSGDKLPVANVSGTVTLDGQPLDKGQIIFSADPSRPPAVIDIIDGKYAGAAPVGTNKIVISAKRKSGGKAAPKLPPGAALQIQGYKEYMKGKSDPPSGAPEFDPTATDIIPPEWGAESKQTRVVEAGGRNEFNFDIKGAKK